MIDKRLKEKVDDETMVKMSPGGVKQSDRFYENKVKYLMAVDAVASLKGDAPAKMGEEDIRRYKKIAQKYGIKVENGDGEAIFQFYKLFGGAYREKGVRYNQIPKDEEK